MDGLKARLSFDAVAYDYDDEYLTIDTDTHTININNVSRLFGVQYDGNSKLIKFRVRNKLSDIQKMQDSIVYINWIDSRGVKGQSIAINKTINNDTCEFAWKVPFDALKNSGVLHFAMSAVVTKNSSSVIDQRWSTQIASVITPDGIYIKSYTPSSEEEDRIAQIYTELSNMINKQNDNLSNLQAQVNLLKEDLGDWSRLEGYELANLKSKLELVKENAYASLSEIGKPPYYGPYDGCNVYSLDIEADIYTFTEARMILPIDGNGNAIAEQTNYATSFNNKDLHAHKLYISLANAGEAIKTFSISKGTQLKKFDTFPDHTGIPKLENDVKKLENDVINIDAPINTHSIKKNGIFEKNGDNILLSGARTNLRKGIRLIFEATVVNGTDFEIGFSVSEASANSSTHNRFVINSTTIEYYEDARQSEYSNSFAHKLSISKSVQVIFEYLANGTVDICLLSNGEMFKQNISFTMTSVAVPYVKSNGLVAKDCKLTFICTDIRKKIWCFGDSYFAYSTARWTYYLKEHGYDNNVLLDGFSGMGSTNARTSFSKLLKLGKPKIAVWFEGMNDGTDTTDSEPNDDWKSNKDIFIALCEENSVEPVFATIPNVPNINHKGKNKWIKESGYRYIDMCHAVGADVDTNWYGSMLSNDKVHPSESGAKALFTQVLLDLPEVMIENL